MEGQLALIAAYRSSVLLAVVSVIFLLTTAHRFSVGFGSVEFDCQLSTVAAWPYKQLLKSLTVWAGAKHCLKRKTAST